MNQSSKPLLCCSESDLCMCNLGVSPEAHMTLCCCFFKALLWVCSGPPSLAFWLESGALTSLLYCILSTAGSAGRTEKIQRGGKNATSWTVEEVGKIMIPPRVLAQRLRYHDAGTITASSTVGVEDNGKHTNKKGGNPPFSLPCGGLLLIPQTKTKEGLSTGLSFCTSCALWGLGAIFESGLGGHQRIKMTDKSLPVQWYFECPNPPASVYFSEITDSCTRHIIQLHSVSAHSLIRTRTSLTVNLTHIT